MALGLPSSWSLNSLVLLIRFIRLFARSFVRSFARPPVRLLLVRLFAWIPLHVVFLLSAVLRLRYLLRLLCLLTLRLLGAYTSVCVVLALGFADLCRSCFMTSSSLTFDGMFSEAYNCWYCSVKANSLSRLSTWSDDSSFFATFLMSQRCKVPAG